MVLLARCEVMEVLIQKLLLLLLAFCNLTWSQTTLTPGVNNVSAQNISTSPQSISLASPVTPATAATNNLAATEFYLTEALSICTCDLTQNACDINCCCDGDCTVEDRLVFSACSDQLESSTDSSYLCTYETRVFKNYAVTTETVNNPFAFCIWRERSKTRDYYNPVTMATSNDLFVSYRNQYSGYSYQYQFTNKQSARTSNYLSGDLIVNYTQPRLDVLYVPSTVGVTTSCIDGNPVKFLQDASSSCLRNLNIPLSGRCETDTSLSAYELARRLNRTRVKKRPTGGVDPVDLIKLHVTGDTPTPVYDRTRAMCIGIIKEVLYTVTHDAGSIESVEVFIIAGNFRDDLTAVEQKNSVTFLKVGDNSLKFTRSGNPGYLVGEPVIAGKRVDDYIALNGDRNNYLTMVTSSADGDCETDSLLRTSVVFGEDFRSGCIWRVEATDITSCSQIKPRVLEVMLGPTRTLADDGSVYVASFGNSDPLKVGDWVKVIVSSQLSSSPCVGVYAHLEIIYANVGSLHNPQAMIIGAQLLLESRDLPFVCIGPYCRYQNLAKTVNMEMVSSVSFVDATEPSQPVIAEKPVSSSKLPANFFHPYYINDATELHSLAFHHCLFLSLFLSLCHIM